MLPFLPPVAGSLTRRCATRRADAREQQVEATALVPVRRRDPITGMRGSDLDGKVDEQILIGQSG